MYRQMYNRSMDPMGIGCRNAVFLFFFAELPGTQGIDCCVVLSPTVETRRERRPETNLIFRKIQKICQNCLDDREPRIVFIIYVGLDELINDDSELGI